MGIVCSCSGTSEQSDHVEAPAKDAAIFPRQLDFKLSNGLPGTSEQSDHVETSANDAAIIHRPLDSRWSGDVLELDGSYALLMDGINLNDVVHIRSCNGVAEMTGFIWGASTLGKFIWDGKALKPDKVGGLTYELQDNGEFRFGTQSLIELSAYWNAQQTSYDVARTSSCSEGRQSVKSAAEELESNPYMRTVGSPLYEALASGSLRLVRASFIKDCWEQQRPWAMRQEIPESALWPPSLACSMWQTYGPVFFFALSYAWLHPVLNDPNMWHLERLAYILNQLYEARLARFLWFCKLGSVDMSATGPPEDFGIFIDYCSLPQQDHSRGIIRSPEEQRQFAVGLGVADMIYGHSNTTVIRITSVPPSEPRKYELRGWPSFEQCVSSSKPGYSHKVLHFDATFSPKESIAHGLQFLCSATHGQSPPLTPLQFSEDLKRRRCVLEQQSLKIGLFSQPGDEATVTSKYNDIWSRLCQTESLAYRNLSWDAEQGFTLASALPHFTKLKSFLLSGSAIGPEALGLLVRSLPTTIEELTIRGSAGEQCVDTVSAALSRLTCLGMLDLSEQTWGDAGVQLIVSQMPQTIHLLELGMVGMSDNGAARIAELSRSFRVLRIYSNFITGKGADLLLPSVQEKLDIRLNRLSEDEKERCKVEWARMGKNVDSLFL